MFKYKIIIRIVIFSFLLSNFLTANARINHGNLEDFKFCLGAFASSKHENLETCLRVYAGSNHGDLEGYYIPLKGRAKTQELYPGESVGEQLGKFKIVLKRQGWNLLSAAEKKRIRRILVIKGVIHGLVDMTQFPPVIEHQLSNKHRDGAFFTQNDISVVLGFELCSPETGAGILRVTELLNLERGTGIYQTLQAGGKISLEGTINACTSKNEFKVIKGEGGLCFGKEICN